MATCGCKHATVQFITEVRSTGTTTFYLLILYAIWPAKIYINLYPQNQIPGKLLTSMPLVPRFQRQHGMRNLSVALGNFCSSESKPWHPLSYTNTKHETKDIHKHWTGKQRCTDNRHRPIVVYTKNGRWFLNLLHSDNTCPSKRSFIEPPGLSDHFSLTNGWSPTAGFTVIRNTWITINNLFSILKGKQVRFFVTFL